MELNSIVIAALASVGSACVAGTVVWNKMSQAKTKLVAEVEQLRRMVGIDSLTNLCTKVAFQNIGKVTVARQDTHVFVAMIDLDGFKAVNDTYGHDAGDQVLTVIGKRLSAALRDSDCVARLGGDEFAAILSGASLSKEEVLDVMSRLVARVNEPIAIRGQSGVAVRVGASVGVVERKASCADLNDLVKEADALMYQVKRGSKNSVQIKAAADTVVTA